MRKPSSVQPNIQMPLVFGDLFELGDPPLRITRRALGSHPIKIECKLWGRSDGCWGVNVMIPNSRYTSQQESPCLYGPKFVSTKSTGLLLPASPCS